MLEVVGVDDMQHIAFVKSKWYDKPQAMQDCAGRDEAQKKKTEAEQARRPRLNEDIICSTASQ